MWGKITRALGLGLGAEGRTASPRRSAGGQPPPHRLHHRDHPPGPGDSSSPLERLEYSLEEMGGFERDLNKLTKHVREFKFATEVFLGGVGSFLRDSQLPGLYDTLAAAPIGGAGGGPETRLAAVEPPPPTSHERLYGSDFHSSLLSSLEPRLAERFESLLLPLSVWTGTYADAKLRLQAARKLESKLHAANRKTATAPAAHLTAAAAGAAAPAATETSEKNKEKGKDVAVAAAAAGGEGGAGGATEPEGGRAAEAGDMAAAVAAPHHPEEDPSVSAPLVAEFELAEQLLAEEVSWLVRGAAHLRAWVAGCLEEGAAGVLAGAEGGPAGPAGVLEPLPESIRNAPMPRRAKDKDKDKARKAATGGPATTAASPTVSPDTTGAAAAANTPGTADIAESPEAGAAAASDGGGPATSSAAPAPAAAQGSSPSRSGRAPEAAELAPPVGGGAGAGAESAGQGGVAEGAVSRAPLESAEPQQQPQQTESLVPGAEETREQTVTGAKPEGGAVAVEAEGEGGAEAARAPLTASGQRE